MSDMAAEGGCFCGAVRYRITAAPIFVNACHCRDCQRLGGSAFSLNGMIEAERVVVLRGAEALSRRKDEVRCAACRVLLWAEHPKFPGGILFVRLGTLDAAERFAPDAHFFVRSRHPWVAIPEGVPLFETLPGEGDPTLFSAAQRARVDAAMAGS